MQKFEFVAVDFDGTLCADRYPEIGEPKPAAIAFVQKLAADGAKIILHTCRENGKRRVLDEALAFCEAQHIPIFAVNDNPANPYTEENGAKERKVYADLYIDDKAVNVATVEALADLKELVVPSVSWAEVEATLEEQYDLMYWAEIYWVIVYRGTKAQCLHHAAQMRAWAGRMMFDSEFKLRDSNYDWHSLEPSGAVPVEQ